MVKHIAPRVKLHLPNRLGTTAAVERIRGSARQKIRAEQFRREPLCRMCAAEDPPRYRHPDHVDHIKPLTEGGKEDWSNRQSLCVECHAIKSRMEHRGRHGLSAEAIYRRLPHDIPRSRIPLEIVCGPPGGGKSTYVRSKATARDLVIDLDAIHSELTGLPEHHTEGREWLARALTIRNERLRALATDTEHERAFFIVGAPNPVERKHWADMLGGSIVLVEIPFAECVRRIKSDPKRAGKEGRMIDACAAWHDINAGLGQGGDTAESAGISRDPALGPTHGFFSAADSAVRRTKGLPFA